MASLPQTPSRRRFTGESVRAGLAVVAALAGVALLLHALLASDPTLLLPPAPGQALVPDAPLIEPLTGSR